MALSLYTDRKRAVNQAELGGEKNNIGFISGRWTSLHSRLNFPMCFTLKRRSKPHVTVPGKPVAAHVLAA